MATCAELRAMLIQAEAAQHELMLGAKVQRVKYGEKDITYTPADLGKLATYIADLNAQVATACGGASTRRIIGIIPQ